MSVRTELQEVVRWLADLSAEKPKPTPEPLTREDWDRVQDNLEGATKKFSGAHLLLARGPLPDTAPSFLTEIAGDLMRQSEGLALRANMLKRRAAPETLAQAQAKAEAREKLEAEAKAKAEARKKARADTRDRAQRDPNAAAEVRAEDEADKVRAQKARAVREGPSTPLKDAIALLKSAQGTVGTALNNVHVVSHPDAVADAFEGELEVLAEMTLSLLQQCEQIDEVETIAQGSAQRQQSEAVGALRAPGAQRQPSQPDPPAPPSEVQDRKVESDG